MRGETSVMSSDIRTLPCAEWAEKLAALHPDDLTSAEHDALGVHLASCSGCAHVYRDYQHLASLVRDLVASEVSPDLLPGLPELPAEQEETNIRSIPASQPGITNSLPTPIPGRRPWRSFKVAVAVIAAGPRAGGATRSFSFSRPGATSRGP